MLPYVCWVRQCQKNVVCIKGRWWWEQCSLKYLWEAREPLFLEEERHGLLLQSQMEKGLAQGLSRFPDSISSTYWKETADWWDALSRVWDTGWMGVFKSPAFPQKVREARVPFGSMALILCLCSDMPDMCVPSGYG